MPDPTLIFTEPIIAGPGRKRNKNCSVELLGLAIYGDYRHGASLPCIDDGCQIAVVRIQDQLDDVARNSRRWRLLIARLAMCHRTGNDRVAYRMALWAARSVEHLNDDPAVKACNDMTERWLAGEVTDIELSAARVAMMKWRTEANAAEAAADAAQCAGESAHDGSKMVRRTAWAASEAARAVALADEGNLVDWVDRYFDAWAKVAADEGCMAPEDMEAAYLDFVSKLDFLSNLGVESKALACTR